ncbi:hypothetical protein GGI04_001968 [Coemansia thaxteri]|nr:hypothetical protein GGI04_001968 [Coemansia thaxteri]KAJ2472036.1 hypothetical protein GGI02_001860 [Coemansia sp. RSA 2322]
MYSQSYFQLAICAVLVVGGGLLAGLTLGLMSLDATNLHILATSGSARQQAQARRIQPLRRHGHWLLVTLLLGNTIINETLPVVMHSVVGGGVQAVLASTALIVLFGEIIPQSLCARYGLAIGAFFAPAVRILQYVLAPIGYPIAMLLDCALGAEHAVTYQRAALKELVSLSGAAHGGSLTADEVTVIQGALQLGEKLVSNVMTDLRSVYMLSIDARLDRGVLGDILRLGHSRVPVFDGARANVVGVLLVKSLILLDPDDAVPVRHVRIADVPLVTPDVSLYDILNAFQEGGSHMAVVVGPPATGAAAASRLGESAPLLLEPPPALVQNLSGYIQGGGRSPAGALSGDVVRTYVPIGIITLEDVIEELIQEEIIDETDVFVDMRRKIKVMRAVKLVQSLAAADSQQQPGSRRRGAAFSSRRRQAQQHGGEQGC